jgi:hypothetical protein
LRIVTSKIVVVVDVRPRGKGIVREAGTADKCILDRIIETGWGGSLSKGFPEGTAGGDAAQLPRFATIASGAASTLEPALGPRAATFERVDKGACSCERFPAIS